jgi:hypothetical protein
LLVKENRIKCQLKIAIRSNPRRKLIGIIKAREVGKLIRAFKNLTKALSLVRIGGTSIRYLILRISILTRQIQDLITIKEEDKWLSLH